SQRILADLTPQYGDSICQWGGGETTVADSFRSKNYRVTVNHEDQLWLPIFPKDKLFTLSYSWALDKTPAKFVLDSLEEVKKHTVDIAWFTVMADESRPKWYWAAAFARVFPRFHYTLE